MMNNKRRCGGSRAPRSGRALFIAGRGRQSFCLGGWRCSSRPAGAGGRLCPGTRVCPDVSPHGAGVPGARGRARGRWVLAVCRAHNGRRRPAGRRGGAMAACGLQASHVPPSRLPPLRWGGAAVREGSEGRQLLPAPAGGGLFDKAVGWRPSRWRSFLSPPRT